MNAIPQAAIYQFRDAGTQEINISGYVPTNVVRDYNLETTWDKTFRYRPNSMGKVIELLSVDKYGWRAIGNTAYFFDTDSGAWIKVAPALNIVVGPASASEINAVALSPAEQSKIREAEIAASKANATAVLDSFRTQWRAEYKATTGEDAPVLTGEIETYQTLQDERVKTIVVEIWEEGDFKYRRFQDGHVEKEEMKGFFESIGGTVLDVAKIGAQAFVGAAAIKYAGASVLAGTDKGQEVIAKVEPTGGVLTTLTKPGAVAGKFAVKGETSIDEIKDALSASAKIASGAVAASGTVASVANAAPGTASLGSTLTAASTASSQFQSADPLKLALSQAPSLNDKISLLQRPEFASQYSLLTQGEKMDIFGVNVDNYVATAKNAPLSDIGNYLKAIPKSVTSLSTDKALVAAGNVTPAQIESGVKSVGAVVPQQNNPKPGFIQSLQGLAGQSSPEKIAGISAVSIVVILAAIYFLTRK